jgi:hypothetical protein
VDLAKHSRQEGNLDDHGLPVYFATKEGRL